MINLLFAVILGCAFCGLLFLGGFKFFPVEVSTRLQTWMKEVWFRILTGVIAFFAPLFVCCLVIYMAWRLRNELHAKIKAFL